MIRKVAMLAALAVIVVGCASQADENVSSTQRGSKRSSSGTPAVADIGAGGRAQVRGASLEVRVAKLDDAEKKVASAIKDSGGFEQSLDSTDLASADASLSIQAKVPVEKVDDVIGKIEGLGTRLSKSISMQDVTAELLAYDSQLRAQKEEAWRIKNHKQDPRDYNNMDEVHRQITTLQSQRDSKSALASFADLTLTLRQGAVPASGQDPNWLAQAYGESSSGAASGFRAVAVGLMWLVFMSPFYLPFAIVGWLIYRSQKKKLGPRMVTAPPTL